EAERGQASRRETREPAYLLRLLLQRRGPLEPVARVRRCWRRIRRRIPAFPALRRRRVRAAAGALPAAGPLRPEAAGATGRALGPRRQRRAGLRPRRAILEVLQRSGHFVQGPGLYRRRRMAPRSVWPSPDAVRDRVAPLSGAVPRAQGRADSLR